jgi:large subunit ribosomal protein L29
MSLSQHKWIKNEKLAGKSLDELRTQLRELKSQAFTHRFDRVTGRLDNFRAIATTRKQVAILQTLIRQKELAAGKENK